ncbi:hypothetical protein C8R47DRAFT_993989 [Mycena vitilis]|nr:hypothetical protein C8R47DRAFT_993989 [Mycena vitilis]
MGRRKIEIQPITHERNRSVTFLKRKNGLFKKAYELGVLCSVDVAVIIFGAPGHNSKLYQYCSGDIANIIQRRIAYNDEKEMCGPLDFSSGGPMTKLDDMADVEEEEEETFPSLGSKRRSEGSRPSTALPTDVERQHEDWEEVLLSIGSKSHRELETTLATVSRNS